MKTVYYDFQTMRNQKYGGISRYYYEIYKYISNHDCGWNAKIDCFTNINKYFEPVFEGKPFRHYFKGSGRIDDFFHINKNMAKKIIESGVDIVQPTYFDPYILDYISNQKLIITVYDMIYELLPGKLGKSDEVIEGKKKLLYASDHIIAISESTKRDILKFYPDIPADRISVIYIGNSFRASDSDNKAELPEKYILFIGNRGAYKNFKTFFEGIQPILEEDKDMYLVCVGGGAFNAEESSMIKGVDDRVIQMDVSDDILQQTYSHAQCFVFPSLYEGFGIPTLEAFSCDCPVVLSNTSSMPEVGGDAVLYINPEDSEDIRNKVHELISNKDLRSDLIKKGREQLKLFDWNKIVPQILDCYDSCLKQQ